MLVGGQSLNVRGVVVALVKIHVMAVFAIGRAIDPPRQVVEVGEQMGVNPAIGSGTPRHLVPVESLPLLVFHRHLAIERH